MTENLEIVDVFCVFKKEDNGEKELKHIVVSEEEAKDHVRGEIRAYLTCYCDLLRTRVEVFDDGATIYNVCDLERNLIDKTVSFTYNKTYAKLLTEG